MYVTVVAVFAVLSFTQAASKDGCNLSKCTPLQQRLDTVTLDEDLEGWCRESEPYIACLKSLPAPCQTEDVKYITQTAVKARKDNKCSDSGAGNVAVTSTLILTLPLFLAVKGHV